jgi:hypothetical protein
MIELPELPEPFGTFRDSFYVEGYSESMTLAFGRACADAALEAAAKACEAFSEELRPQAEAAYSRDDVIAEICAVMTRALMKGTA